MSDKQRELEEFLGKREETVPTNEYQRFLNAYVFVNSSDRRQDAVKRGHEVWQKSSREVVEHVYQAAVNKMSKIRRSITSFFKCRPMECTDSPVTRGV